MLSGSVGYLRASAAGIPFLYVSYAGNGHLVGLANARTPLRIAVTANVLNVALEVFLVYGLHRVHAEPGGQHPVERCRRAAPLDVPEHRDARLRAG